MRTAWVVLALAVSGMALGQALPPIDAPDPAPLAIKPPRILGPAKPLEDTVPTCHCQAQCEAMWAKSPDAIEAASHMRVRLATDSLVDTYAPTRIGYAHGRAIKMPDGQGGYQFVASFDTSPRLPDVELSAHRIFNISLQDPTTMALCSHS